MEDNELFWFCATAFAAGIVEGWAIVRLQFWMYRKVFMVSKEKV